MDRSEAKKCKKNKKKIGILGGTFDPIHIGHLFLADTVRQNLKLDKILFIPVNKPPHKDRRKILNKNLRYQMVKLAIAGNQDFIASPVEIRKNGVSYSIETLRILKRCYPDADFYLIIGSDACAELKLWKNIDELFNLCQFVMAARPDFKISCRSRLMEKIKQLPGKFLKISSTQIRKKIKKGISVRYLVPEKVYQFIHKRKLYRK
ncbi:MAG: nicotinate-nucleotide adenylyltransferase [Candidatus Omnitrophota bacterium]